jgi:2-dehydropantoate 2-reductase
VAVKSYDVAAVLASLRHLTGRLGAALSVQNGGGKDEALAGAFGPDAVVGAATMVGAAMPEPGRVVHTGDGMTWIGELDGRPSARVDAIAGLFRAGGLRIAVVPDIRSATWCKLHQYVPAAILSCLTRLHLHEIYLEPSLAALFVEMSREVARLADRLGIPLGDYQGFPVKTLCAQPDAEAVEGILARGRAMRERGMTGVRVSILQDLERGRRTEIEDTVGYVVRLAGERGVALPTVSLGYRILRGTAAAARGVRAPSRPPA